MASDGTIKIRTELDSSKAQSAMSKFSSLSSKAMKGVKIAVGTVSATLSAMAGYSVKVGADFEAGMSKVSAISGATSSELAALSNKAKEMGAKTKFSATEAASAFEYMAMAGWKTEDMLNGIDGVMNLAAASGESLAITSDIVTDALTAFKLQASDAAHFADVLAVASSKSNTNVGMMGETFKYIAPVAGALGFSVEDCAVAIGLMANSGIKAGQAGTSLRQIFTNLVKPTDEMQEVMDKLGISITDAQGNAKSLDTVMKDLRSGFAGLTEEEKANYAATLAGQEGMSGLLAIVNASDADFDGLTSAINHADGAAEDMAATMNNNLKGSLTIAKSAAEGFGIKIYESIEGSLKSAVDKGTGYINRLSSAFSSGGLNGVVKEAAEIFDEVTDDIAGTSKAAEGIITPLKNIVKIGGSLAKSVLPVAADGFEFLAENMSTAIPLLVTGATAIKGYSKISSTVSLVGKFSKAWMAASTAVDAYNVVQIACTAQGVISNATLTVGQAAVGLLTGRVTLATAAQTAWNAAMNANVIGIVITAAAALAAGLVALNIVTDEASERNYKLSEKQKEVLKATEETTEVLNEQRSARQDSVQSIDMEYDSYEALLSELRSIADENGNVKAGYEERAAVIAGQLSDALGTEIELTDGVIQNYHDTVAAIDEVITKKKAEALCTALQEDMANAYKNSQSAMLDYKEAVSVLEDKQKDLNKAEENYIKVSELYEGQIGPKAQLVERAKKSLEEAQEAFDEASQSVDGARTSLNELSTEVNNYDALMQAMAEGSAESIESAMNALLTGYQSYTADMLAESQTAQEEMLAQARDSISVLSVLLDEGGASYQAFGEDAAKAVANSVSDFNNLPGGIAAAIKRIGPESGSAMIAALAQADLDGKLDAEGKEAMQSLIIAFDGLDTETQEIMANAVFGALNGLEGFEDLADPAKEGADAFLESLKEALEVHSPSVAVERIFSQVWPGASQGLENGSEELTEKGSGVISDFLSALSGNSLLQGAMGVGKKLMQFFSQGISSHTRSSSAAGKANADAANTGAASVNPTGTGSIFGGLFSGGIAGMFGTSLGHGRNLADNAKSGAGSVNPTGTGSTFGSQYASGVGSQTRAANVSGIRLGSNAESGAGSADGYGPGSDFGAGFVSGIGGWLGAAAQAAADLAISAYNALRSALEEHSPSRKAKRSGKNFDLGFDIGLEENADVPVKTAEQMASRTLDALSIDEIYEKMKELDIPDIMSGVYLAVDTKQAEVAGKVVAAVGAKEDLAWKGMGDVQSVHLSEEDMYKLGEIFAEKAAPLLVKSMSGLSMEMYGEKVGALLAPVIDAGLSVASIKAGRHMG